MSPWGPSTLFVPVLLVTCSSPLESQEQVSSHRGPSLLNGRYKGSHWFEEARVRAGSRGGLERQDERAQAKVHSAL